MDRKLSQEEMDALLSSPGASGAGSASGAVLTDGDGARISVYNFRRPDRFPKAALQSLQLLHDRFCTTAAASLSAYFRTLGEMSVVSIEQANFSEFLNSLPDPSYLNAVSMRPLQGMAVLEIGPDVSFPLIDRLLGGTGASAPAGEAGRKMTDIEKNVIRGLINLLTTDLSEAWRPVSEIVFHVHSNETRPQLLQVAPPNEVVLVVTLELRMAEIRGAIHLCLPFTALEPILGTFEQGAPIERKENRSDLVKVLRCLMRAPINVGCELPPTMVTVNDLLSVTNGDIMRLDSKVDDRVRVVVGGNSAFEASLVDVDGRKSMGIIGRYTG